MSDLRSKVKKKKLMKKGNKSQIWGEGGEKEKSRKRVKKSKKTRFRFDLLSQKKPKEKQNKQKIRVKCKNWKERSLAKSEPNS